MCLLPFLNICVSFLRVYFRSCHQRLENMFEFDPSDVECQIFGSIRARGIDFWMSNA